MTILKACLNSVVDFDKKNLKETRTNEKQKLPTPARKSTPVMSRKVFFLTMFDRQTRRFVQCAVV